MEATASATWMPSPNTLIYITIALIIAVAGYMMYKLVEPSKSKALNKAIPTFKAYEQVTKLGSLGCPAVTSANAGRLCDYYIAGSSYSVFPGAEIYDYVSDSIIPLVVKSGARIVELDIYSDSDGSPVVGLKNQKLGTDYAYNTVPFEACCVSICNTAFNSITCPVSSDPFVLSCSFQTTNSNTINACARILADTCRAYLLDETYSYNRKNLATEPLCNLQRKLIIVSGGGDIKGTLFEELVNLSWSSSNLRRMTYSQASQPHDYEELVDYNREHITMVVPDSAGGVLGAGDLVNYNPQILFTYGCQWNLMNYGSLDNMMELYIGQFQENSLVLKPAPLRPLTPKKYTMPTMPDPSSVSFQPMQKTSPIYNIII